jgi:hypothetical protein
VVSRFKISYRMGTRDPFASRRYSPPRRNQDNFLGFFLGLCCDVKLSPRRYAVPSTILWYVTSCTKYQVQLIDLLIRGIRTQTLYNYKQYTVYGFAYVIILCNTDDWQLPVSRQLVTILATAGMLQFYLFWSPTGWSPY